MQAKTSCRHRKHISTTSKLNRSLGISRQSYSQQNIPKVANKTKFFSLVHVSSPNSPSPPSPSCPCHHVSLQVIEKSATHINLIVSTSHQKISNTYKSKCLYKSSKISNTYTSNTYKSKCLYKSSKNQQHL
jgi:hypothetical protein